MRRKNFLRISTSLLTLLFVTAACKTGNFQVTDKAGSGADKSGPGPRISPISFSGIDSINASNTSVRLNSTHAPGAIIYNIYNLTSGSAQLIGTVVAPTATYSVTGLTAATT